jgi:hypothetical protein
MEGQNTVDRPHIEEPVMARIPTLAACVLCVAAGALHASPLPAQCCAPWAPEMFVGNDCCAAVPNCPVVQASCGSVGAPLAAWETRRQLAALGLPVPIAAQYGAAADSCCASALAPYAGACDLSLQQSLQQVDWPAAVRQGARNAAVRGFVGGQSSSSPCPDGSIRTLVHDTVVEGFNRAGQGAAAGDLGRFQALIAAGVEDAIVEGLNYATVPDAQAGPYKKAAPPLTSPTSPSPPNSPTQPEKKPLFQPPPPPAATGVKAAPAKELQSPARTTALGPIATPVSWSHLASPEVSTRAAENPSFVVSDAFRRHYAGRDDAADCSARYGDYRLVASGWLVSSAGIVPLADHREFLVLSLRGDSEYVEVWSRGVLIAEKCRYVQYFEDAKRLRKPF